MHLTLNCKKLKFLFIIFRWETHPMNNNLDETFDKFMSIVFTASLNKFQQQLFSVDKRTFEQILKKTDINGDTLLHVACTKYKEGKQLKEEEKIITILVEKGANIHTRNFAEETPLEIVDFDPKMKSIMRGK